MEEDVDRFIKKLRRIIDSERERGLTYSECIGCLEIIKNDMIAEESEESDFFEVNE